MKMYNVNAVYFLSCKCNKRFIETQIGICGREITFLRWYHFSAAFGRPQTTLSERTFTLAGFGIVVTTHPLYQENRLNHAKLEL
jgi:hypothetical protein